MDNEIDFFDSSETGAPSLTNAAGSKDAVLYACLVTGFRTITLDSVVVVSGVATATYSAGHGYADKRVLLLAGAATSAINGRKRITVTGASTFTFPAPGVADGAVSGTIVAKRAPLGWARPVSSGNVSIYTRTDVAATAMALRVDDSGSGAAAANYARARMLESYSDLNTFTNPSPPAGALDGAGVYWPRRNTSSAQSWVLVGDGRTFYLLCDSDNYYMPSYPGLQGIYAFGDVASFRSGDAYACMLSGSTSTSSQSGYNPAYYNGAGSTPNDWSFSVCRGYAGIGQAVRMHAIGMGTSSAIMGSYGPPFPSPVDNGLLVLPGVPVAEANAALNNPLRGTLRGMAAPLASMQSGQLHLQVLDNLVGSDRRWLFVSVGQSSSHGHVAFDITGPW